MHGENRAFFYTKSEAEEYIFDIFFFCVFLRGKQSSKNLFTNCDKMRIFR